MRMFSPTFCTAVVRSTSRSAPGSAAIFFATSSQNALKASFFATKSVSQLTSIIEPDLPSGDTKTATIPSAATRADALLAALKATPGVTPFPSQANMILARVADARRTFEGMKALGVLVKNVSAFHPLLANCLRLTVGTPDENQQMLNALKKSLS